MELITIIKYYRDILIGHDILWKRCTRFIQPSRRVLYLCLYKINVGLQQQ